MTTSVALIGVSDGLGRGKMTYDYFLPPFEKTLAAQGIQIRYYGYLQFILSGERHDATILLYGEVMARKNLQLWNMIVDTAKAARKRGTAVVVHGPEIGRIVADKTLTNETLSNAGIEMPKRVSGPAAPFKVFSNKNMGSHEPVNVVDARMPLNGTRYNTEWIDTQHEHDGRSYYVVLRAMAVGSQCVSVFVRARPADQDDVSVHNTDTPVHAELWNSLYERLVVPRMPELESLCQRIAGVLGLGFYSHDILPEIGGRLLVCETGFKFDDYLFRTHLMPLAGKLVSDNFLSDRFAIRSAELFASELKKIL